MRDDFVAFILTHGRPNKVSTLRALRRYGYTGDYYLIIDDEDDTIDQYKDNFGKENIIVFDKQKATEEAERGDNLDNRQVILYARNKCFDIAEDLGYQYFMELDDDYVEFQYRFDPNFDYNPLVAEFNDLDHVLNEFVKFYQKIDTLTIAFSQGVDWIGGEKASLADKLKIKRKAMNTFLCSPERRFQFRGSINEDVNTYTRQQQLGDLIFTVNAIAITQGQTQKTKSGMTDIYLEKGTYIKSFYTVLYSPSSVTLRKMGSRTNPRIHHSINWRYTVPKILSEEYKK